MLKRMAAVAEPNNLEVCIFNLIARMMSLNML